MRGSRALIEKSRRVGEQQYEAFTWGACDIPALHVLAGRAPTRLVPDCIVDMEPVDKTDRADPSRLCWMFRTEFRGEVVTDAGELCTC
mmetsp:Transcript_29934/g.79757  ORF Transcript_29934/g.79757 Transcript_29934/m.79757 type:complete len:88 (-) Transcript_29934:3024-3287(-)